MFTIPSTGFTPAASWAIACDGCGLRVRGFEEFEGSGSEGLAQFRRLLAAIGWTSDRIACTDLCPECVSSNAATTIGHASTDLVGAPR